MTDTAPLPPHLAQFVREQLVAGRFRSESEVIHAGLRLLEEQALSREASDAWLERELDRGLRSRPSEPATNEFWDGLRSRLQAESACGDDS